MNAPTKAWVTVLIVASVSQSFAKIRRDTYLSAYMESHGHGALTPGEVYGAPSGDYGAPASGYSYGPPADEPHDAKVNPLDPIHAKVVLLFKVLLKILIFKLIVKFIAIICVLFFLPKLSELGVAKEESRRISDRSKGADDDDDRLRLTQFVLDALSGRSLPQPRDCREDSVVCKVVRRLRELDTRYSVHRLFKDFLKEESGKLRKLHYKS